MGIDTKVSLPPDTRVRDVADALSALLGQGIDKRESGNTYWARGNAVVRSNDAVPECANILVGDDVFLYHYEFGRNGERGIIRRARAHNIALLYALAKFFGGSVDFNDCDAVEADVTFEKPRATNAPEDGKEWYELQDGLLGLRPMTQSEIEVFEKHAAYK